jgi:Tol biopolymer transport system component
MRHVLLGAACAVLVVACSGATPIASSAPTSTPSPTPLAVLPGEPWIVYNWFLGDSDHKTLFLARADGSDAHAIVAGVPGENRAPAWSPDGMTLAFVVRNAEFPEGSIWTANADGSDPKLLSDGGTECPVGLFHPAWSPEGKQLAVVCYPGGNDRESIAILDVATKALTRLADFSSPEHLDNPPTWSRDGQTIAFDLQHFDSTGESLDWSVVATVPVAGGAVNRLTSPDASMAHPDWRPDGLEIVMNSYDLGNVHTTDQPSNLYAIKPDGTGLRQLTHSSVDGAMRIAQANWAPDGSRIVVSIGTSSRPDMEIDNVQLAFVDAAGGEPVLFDPAIRGSAGDLRPTP